MSRTLCSRKWFRLAVDADRASGMRNLSYSRSHQSDEKKLPGQFSDHAIESTRYFFGPQGAESHTAGQVCLVLSNAKNQFWAGGPLLYRSSRNCKLCKHVKTLCFGRNFPYRREALQNFDCESPIFEFLQFGTILLKFKRGVFLSRSVPFFHMYVAQLLIFLKFQSELSIFQKRVKIRLVLSASMTSVHTGLSGVRG